MEQTARANADLGDHDSCQKHQHSAWKSDDRRDELAESKICLRANAIQARSDDETQLYLEQSNLQVVSYESQ